MNSHKIEIRKVKLSEVEALLNISSGTFVESFGADNSASNMQKYVNESFTIEKIRTALENPNSEFYFAVIDEEVVGYIKVNMGNAQTEASVENALEIERIYVLGKYQKQKVGQILFDKALEIAKSRSLENVWLGVWEKNYKAIRFYEKNGFVAFGKHIFNLGDDPQTDIMMTLSLKSRTSS